MGCWQAGARQPFRCRRGPVKFAAIGPGPRAGSDTELRFRMNRLQRLAFRATPRTG